ncbi:MAG: hypothetical protein ACSLE1_00965 [Sphingobium sp.]
MRVPRRRHAALQPAARDDTKNVTQSIFEVDRPHRCVGHFLARAEFKKMFGLCTEMIGRFRIAPGYRGGTKM